MEQLWSRLRQRKLVQWAIAYLAGAWLVLQVLDLLARPFSWPNLVIRAATVLLAVGFLAVLVLAWYHGEKGKQKATGVELVMLAGILTVAATSVALVARREGPQRALPQVTADIAVTEPDAPAVRGSIAVLPFADLSPGKDQEYLADGIAEQLITALSALENLRVPARTSAFAYKGSNTDIRAIAAQLRVAHVLEGSVMKASERVRITAQLIDANTGYHLWSETFDREITDIFAVQDEISHAIVSRLRVRLGAAEQAALTRHGTSSVRAYELYLLGLHYWNMRTAESVTRALDYFTQAAAVDPRFATAHARLALTYSALPEYRGDAPEDTWRLSRAAAQEALALDSSVVEAHLALALYEANWNRDLDAADALFQRALESNPNNAVAHFTYGFMLRGTGRAADAVRHVARARELDPLSTIYNVQLGFALQTARRFDEALAQVRHTIALDPETPLPYWTMGEIHLSQRRFPEAARYYGTWAERTGRDAALLTKTIEEIGRQATAGATSTERQQLLADIQRLKFRTGRTYHDDILGAELYSALGEKKHALDTLERAADQRQLLVFLFDPIYDSIRSEPRFQRLLRRAGVSY
jgi:adenylate cyclase